MTDDLVSRLSETLDEIERVALAAIRVGSSGEWTRGLGHAPEHLRDVDTLEPVVYDEGSPTDRQFAHIARWDPKAVLGLVAAVREIIAEHEPIGEKNWWGEPAGRPCGCCMAATSPCDTVRALLKGFGITEPEAVEETDGFKHRDRVAWWEHFNAVGWRVGTIVEIAPMWTTGTRPVKVRVDGTDHWVPMASLQPSSACRCLWPGASSESYDGPDSDCPEHGEGIR